MMAYSNEKKKISVKAQVIIEKMLAENTIITYEMIVQKMMDTSNWGAQEIALAIQKELDCIEKEGRVKYTGRGDYKVIKEVKG